MTDPPFCSMTTEHLVALARVGCNCRSVMTTLNGEIRCARCFAQVPDPHREAQES